MIKRMACAFGLAVLFAAVPAGGALAAKGGVGTETLTEHFHEAEFFAFEVTNPCTGQKGLLSALATNGVFHITTQADGELWATGTGEGTATFVPFAPGTSYSGHFTTWFGESLNQRNRVDTDTTTIVLSGPEGARVTVKLNGHVSTNASGVVTAEFERENVRFSCE